MQRWFNIWKSINVIHINRTKGEKTTWSFWLWQKNTWQNPIPFHDKKKTRQARNRREFPPHDKGIYEKFTVNIIQWWKTETFSLTSRKKPRCLLLSPLLLNTALEVLAREKEKERDKRHWTWKGISKTITRNPQSNDKS